VYSDDLAAFEPILDAAFNTRTIENPYLELHKPKSDEHRDALLRHEVIVPMRGRSYSHRIHFREGFYSKELKSQVSKLLRKFK